MDSRRAAAIGSVLGCATGLFAALASGADVLTTLLRAVFLAAAGAALGVFAFLLNHEPDSADKSRAGSGREPTR